jgi:hypothetical protein
MPTTLGLLNAALYSRLSGGTALTGLLAGTASVYNGQAPDAAPFDYVVFSCQGGGPENITPSRMEDITLFVRGYSKKGAAAADAIDAQIDILLHGKPLTVPGWTNFWVMRESYLVGTDALPNTVKVWMSGGLYRARLDS